jgi:hypothetical protein
MKELDIFVFITVIREILGLFFWPLIAVIVLGAVSLVYVILRDRRIFGGRLIWSEMVGLIGGFFAIWFTFFITNSSLGEIGGPIDWVLLIVIWVLGAIGGTILAYVGLGLLQSRTSAAH